MTYVVNVKNVTKCYQNQAVLEGINLSVDQGEVFVLLGKNGAGKSSLFKLLVGLSSATDGQLEVLGEERDLSKNLGHIGFNINEPVFYEHLTARENLEIHCQYMACDTRLIDYWLTKVGLSKESRTPVKQFSTGMRQRLVLARSLIHDPKLLVIDEPLNGLDPKGIKEFRVLIGEVAQTGKTVIMSSHILSEVSLVATQIAVLADGKIILNESKEQLCTEHPNDLEDYLILKMEGRN